MPDQSESASDPRTEREEELTRMVRDGVHPVGVKERMQVAVDKLTGKVPLGVTAANKTARKVLGASSALFVVVKYGFLGIVLVMLGALFVFAGLSSGVEWKALLVGVACLVLGAWSLRTAYTGWRNLRAISRA